MGATSPTRTANYSGRAFDTDEGCLVRLEIENGDTPLDCYTTELLIGALRGAQRVADEYNDRLAKLNEKKRARDVKRRP